MVSVGRPAAVSDTFKVSNYANLPAQLSAKNCTYNGNTKFNKKKYIFSPTLGFCTPCSLYSHGVYWMLTAKRDPTQHRVHYPDC